MVAFLVIELTLVLPQEGLARAVGLVCAALFTALLLWMALRIRRLPASTP